MVQDPLVSTAWLAEHLNAPDVRIIDASLFMPGDPRDQRAEYALVHIPGAVFFDIEDIVDETSDLPHMLPSAVKFASRMRKLGIGDGARLVIYDSQGLFSAPRAWWTFRAMGHEDVVVLDGGLPKWIAEGRPVEEGVPPPRERHFTTRYNNDLVRDQAQVRRALASGKEQLVDARSLARFRGEAPEPREGLRGGHMPGALCVPFQAVIAPDGTLKPAEQLKAVFEEAGVDLARPIVTTCGSGVTASILALALARLGRDRTAVYDGSWSEWGLPGDTEVVTGAGL
jgi:thiosulfate/3-mercaptopyruvate sulfurtransferase